MRGAFADGSTPPRNDKLDLAAKYLPDQPWLKTAPNWWGDGRALLLYGDREPSNDPLSYTVRPFAMIVAPEPGDDTEPVTIVADVARLSVTSTEHPRPPGQPGTEPRLRITQPVTAFPSGEVRLRGPNGLTLSAPSLEVDWATKRIQVSTEAVLHLPGVDLRVSGATIDPLRKDLGLGEFGVTILAASVNSSPSLISDRTEGETLDEFDLEMLDFRIDKFQSGARNMWAMAAQLEIIDGEAEDIERATAKALKLTAKAKDLRRQRDELRARLGGADAFGARNSRQTADATVANEIVEQYKTVIKEIKGQLDELGRMNADLESTGRPSIYDRDASTGSRRGGP